MIYSILYFVLALLGLGFLIFIHELGHYYMARKVGMRVEAFAIGFGKPLYVWEKDGVKWQICCLPFGGYVKIAGMEKKGGVEPHKIADGFYGRGPWRRIQVAFMGPLVNIVFAFFVFALIWATGGRFQQFSEHTQFVGWVDPRSQLYVDGVRPGNRIAKIGESSIHGFSDLRYDVAFGGKALEAQAYRMDYCTGQERPFTFLINGGEDRHAIEKRIMEVSALTPAQFLVFHQKWGTFDPMGPGSPMEGSGIQNGDRIVWVDGQLVFSLAQLISVINEPRTLLTIQRGDDVFLARVPRLNVCDIQFSEEQKAELDDWRNEMQLEQRFADLYFIPYNLSKEAIVEEGLHYVNEGAQHTLAYAPSGEEGIHKQERPLLPGDRIIAIDGQKVTDAFDIVSLVQKRNVQMIVSRQPEGEPLFWERADQAFLNGMETGSLMQMVSAIGTPRSIEQIGQLHLLKPVTPKPFLEFPQSPSKTRWLENKAEAKGEIEKIEDPAERAMMLKNWERDQNLLRLGIVLQDRQVEYNPSPFVLFADVCQQTWRVLQGLITGYIPPKMLSGPVGIVTVIHHGWSLGLKEALFWLGMISLNLGIFNLLPIPVLDGGHICFALWEGISKKPIQAKVMERLIIPFVLLLIALLIFTTYHDLSRLIKGLF